MQLTHLILPRLDTMGMRRNRRRLGPEPQIICLGGGLKIGLARHHVWNGGTFSLSSFIW